MVSYRSKSMVGGGGDESDDSMSDVSNISDIDSNIFRGRGNYRGHRW